MPLQGVERPVDEPINNSLVEACGDDTKSFVANYQLSLSLSHSRVSRSVFTVYIFDDFEIESRNRLHLLWRT